ncbi:MAG: TonB-dependent receptor, partial [Acidobacteriota bacterium]|nr:TonB-dependent receptor [Acidobacteriota bacterium]
MERIAIAGIYTMESMMQATSTEDAVAERGRQAGRRVPRMLVVLLTFLFSISVWGQSFTGRVTDQTGAAVPNAGITVQNVATNVAIRTTTTGTGDYTVPYLKPGPYRITASASGFHTTVHSGLTLQVDQTATVNFALNVGTASETVTVRGDAPIDFAKADAGEVVENTRVTELPLNGRDPGMLSELVAGASFEGSIKYQRPFDDTQQQLSVNGGGTGNTELMLDGVSNATGGINESGLDRIAYVPPVDSVQEFKIITNPYDAKYGLLAGGVEDVTLKSGTNKLHGDVYEFARRTWLDANTWQNDWNISRAAPGADVSQFRTLKHKLDQYGAELDGPIFIPKIYNGRDKTFFTLQYENWNESAPNTTTTSVPSPQWLTGDFSNLVYLNGKSLDPITLYDPLSITQNPITGVYTRVPFGPTDPVDPTSAPNIIPASRINPVALKILSYLPAPNTAPSSANPFQNNYTLATPAINKYRNVLGKFDQNISSSDRLSMHYGYWEREEVRNGNGIPGPAASGLLPHIERSNTFTLEETHTFTPTLLLDFRGTVAARVDGIINGPSFDPTTLGWSPAEVAAMGSSAQSEFPYIQLNEFVATGQNGTGSTQSNTLALFPSVTWTKGKHAIQGGLDARFWQSDNNRVAGGNNFWVDRSWTQMNCGSCGSWDPASGNSIASFLLGNPTSGSNTINAQTFWSAHYWAPFLQDDWKVTRRLTLNLGIRWDFLPAEVERHNRTDGAFNTTAVNPINAEVAVPGYSRILGGVTFAGVNGNPRGAYALDKGNVQPRVGFAFELDPKTVLRGGFGESMRQPQNNAPSFGYSATT